MAALFSSSTQRLIKGHATNFVLIDSSVDNLTFDTGVTTSSGQPFDLGGHLHTLYTNEITDKADNDLREYLAGLGITYDVVKKHTLKDRAENPDQLRRFMIKDFVPSKPVPEASTATEAQQQKNSSGSNDMTPKSKPKSSSPSKKPDMRKPNLGGASKPISRIGKKPNDSVSRSSPKKTLPGISVTLDEALTKYEHWYLYGGPGGIAYALRNHKADAENASQTNRPPKKDIMVGNVPVDREEFISVLQLLHGNGLLDKRTLKPAGNLKDRIDKAVTRRDVGRFRALQIHDSINH